MTLFSSDYAQQSRVDECLDDEGQMRQAYQVLIEYLQTLDSPQLLNRKHFVENALLRMGITFNVYSESEGSERIFPVDIIPRVVSGREWYTLEKGLKQRIVALNAFLQDIYKDQLILKDGIIPKELVLSSKGYLKPCEGLTPPKGIWCHITGTDLIRNQDGQFYVLEDNLRCPSGVAYVIENREIMKRAFSTLIQTLPIRPVSDYVYKLYKLMMHVAANDQVSAAVLTPGIYNSAYFEHSFLARQMGIELVQSQDLVVKDGFVQMKTTKGYQKLDVIYRRIDDVFLDPTVFRSDSLLGIPGLFDVYRKGHVTLVNAPGTGVADDKVIYAFVPDMIRYYLGEDPILPNVETFVCAIDEHKEYVLKNIEKLVVKAANEAGGYGMLVGPHATAEEHEEFRKLVSQNPRNYIAQPTVQFSTAPTLVGTQLEPRHVDLRPYILYGEDVFVLHGGLTRVALRKGSLVVNSSQGGGSKDTWVLGV